MLVHTTILLICTPLEIKACRETKKDPSADTAEMVSLEEKAHATIMLCLADDIITEIADQDTAAGLWLKLESLYMMKSLTNKLLLK